MRRARAAWRLAGGALCTAMLVLWCMAPLLWQFVTSIKPDAEITAIPVRYWPEHPSIAHYLTLFARKPFAHYLLNSLVVSAGATALCLLAASLAAYAFARMPPRGARWLLAGLAAIAFFPAIAFFFPMYELVRAARLINNPIALIVPYAAFNLPLAVFFLTAYFKSIPIEIEEAALVDGMSRLQILRHLVLPLSAPGMVTVAILVFIASWNEFLLALTFMPRDEARTVTVAIAALSGGSVFELPWGLIGAAIVTSVAPLLVLVALFQRRIVEGLTSGATVS